MKCRIFLKSFDVKLLHTALNTLKILVIETQECELLGIVNLPCKIKRFCVLRSPHIDKNSREHFEIRISKCFLDFQTTQEQICNVLMGVKFPAGVQCTFKILN
jgi:small subunit ribosomal protein S10